MYSARLTAVDLLEAIIRLKDCKEGLDQSQFWSMYKMLRYAFYQSRQWKELAKIVRSNQDRRCAYCGYPGRLDVHHKVSIFDNPSDALWLGNLIGVCRGCHENIHGR